MKKEVDSFLQNNGFERNTSLTELGNIITLPFTQKIMGYAQIHPNQSKRIKTTLVCRSAENLILRIGKFGNLRQ